MKIAASSCWLLRQEQRLKKVKIWQQRKIASELTVLRVQSASLIAKRKQHQRLHQDTKDLKLFLRRGTNMDYSHSGTFQEAIRPASFIIRLAVLVLAQIFALMPVQGVTSNSAAALNFSWKHIRTVYSLLVIASFGGCFGFTIAYAFRSRFNFDSSETIIFYFSTVCIALAFFNLARKWPALMLQWEQVERDLPPLATEKERSMLAHRIKMITIIATSCSLVEHLLSMLSIIYYVSGCPVMPNKPIESFLFSSFSQFFYFVEYNTLAGIIGKIINVLSTFAWNFNDIFVMSVSVALSARFHEVNEHMLNAVRWPTTTKFWTQSRINYRNLCRLCDAVDNTISTITMLCFCNNLYFICSKILKSLQKKPSITHTVYFWYSLSFLLGRTFLLTVYAAKINDESKRPLVIFRRISREFWCPELKRFSEEVTTDIVALSGMKFFHLTRSLVLSVAGTIVTYELVLLQFNKQNRVNDCNEF